MTLRQLVGTWMCIGLLGMLAPTPAMAADPKGWVFENDDPHPFDISLTGVVGSLFGGAVIFGIPVAAHGFAPDINDAFFLEIEGGAGGWPTRAWDGGAFTMVGARYQLHIFEWFAVHFCGRGGIDIPFDGGRVRGVGYGAIGIMLIANEHVAFRLEGGYGGRVGLTLMF